MPILTHVAATYSDGQVFTYAGQPVDLTTIPTEVADVVAPVDAPVEAPVEAPVVEDAPVAEPTPEVTSEPASEVVTLEPGETLEVEAPAQ